MDTINFTRQELIEECVLDVAITEGTIRGEASGYGSIRKHWLDTDLAARPPPDDTEILTALNRLVWTGSLKRKFIRTGSVNPLRTPMRIATIAIYTI